MNLVERLRAIDHEDHDLYINPQILAEAADRIEAIERALQEVLQSEPLTMRAEEILQTALDAPDM